MMISANMLVYKDKSKEEPSEYIGSYSISGYFEYNKKYDLTEEELDDLVFEILSIFNEKIKNTVERKMENIDE